MLILTRRPGEDLQFRLKDGEIITITSLRVSGNQTRLGISAPDDVIIMRNEVLNRQGGWGNIK